MNVFMTEKEFELNVAKWVNKEVRVLYVTGLSGSGKTTLSKEWAKTYDAKLVSLDNYLRVLLNDTHEGAGKLDYEKACYDRGVEALLKDNPEGQLIIEGGRVTWLDSEKVLEGAVVVKRTSLARSIWQAIKRDFTWEHWVEWGFIRPDKHIRFNCGAYKRVKAFEDAVKG